MNVTLRSFTPSDYAAMASIIAATSPEHPVSVKELEYRDNARDPKCRSWRWVAEAGGGVVGYAHYTQHADIYHPQIFWLELRVHPDYQRRGIGSALYRQALEGLEPFKPIALKLQLRQDQQPGIHFATLHGFKEIGRRFEARLEVASFNPAPFARLEPKLTATGIRILSYTELAHDPERDHKLYTLQSELDADVPMLDEATRLNFEQFKRQLLDHPAFVPDGLFIALEGDAYIGMSSFFKQGSDELLIDLTGVRRAYRRRGIATALKLRGIAFAKAHGYRIIIVHNDTANTGMLAINEQLGFVPQPAWFQYLKSLSG